MSSLTLHFVKILSKCCQKATSLVKQFILVKWFFLMTSWSPSLLFPVHLSFLWIEEFKFIFKSTLLKIIYNTLNVNIFLGQLFWIQFNGIYYFPWEILSSSKLNLFFFYITYTYCFIFPKIKTFFHSCKKIIKEKIAAAWQFLMQSFPTSHTMMMKAEKYEVIHVFLEIKVFFTHWMTMDYH